ncbi:MAG: DUF302 domain-containing protein [Gammaproteobacteria bacterium]|nr:DUF302 domain-containing protein [Gammaproteobacteria bacterium]MDH5776598.1 DUF302 domain-containing protein [Gammaproteobacteria bacterium]
MIMLSQIRAMLTALLLTVLFCNSFVHADEIMMVRAQQSFPEAMSKLQEQIKAKGYVVSRVQRVDIGLTKSGYKTDKYRVVFFGKPDEIRHLVKNYPELQAYLPLKISIFAEGSDTILVAANPHHLQKAGGKQLTRLMTRWEQDIAAIFATMREDE